MSETNNSQTIDSYNNHIQEYLDGTPHEVSGTVKDWIDRTFVDVQTSAQILEFGSAFGRDADYLKRLGYSVICTDATPAFVGILRQKGYEANILNAINDELPQNNDVVLANAVLLHFTRDEAAQVAKKVHGSLNNGGTFAFTVKQGEGEEWSSEKIGAPRFFTYWTEPQVRDLLTNAGFDNIEIWGDQATERSVWLQIIAKKTEQ